MNPNIPITRNVYLTCNWQEMAEKALRTGNALVGLRIVVNSIKQEDCSSTGRLLQIQYRYPSPLKRSVRLDRPLFLSHLLLRSVPPPITPSNCWRAAPHPSANGNLADVQKDTDRQSR